jgi:SAM-dependent methyltransferase
VLPFAALPKEWLNFPQRCAQLVDAWASKLDLPRGRALDIGCAVGGSTFELARTYDDVVGVDLSASFIAAAQRMHAEREIQYLRRDEGELGETAVARVDGLEAAGDILFERADACALPHELGRFDACLLGNLLCRLPSPKACLSRLGGPDGLVKPGGLAVVVSPYTWMEEHTPKETVSACVKPRARPASHCLSAHLRSCLADSISFFNSLFPPRPHVHSGLVASRQPTASAFCLMRRCARSSRKPVSTSCTRRTCRSSSASTSASTSSSYHTPWSSAVASTRE